MSRGRAGARLGRAQKTRRGARFPCARQQGVRRGRGRGAGAQGRGARCKPCCRTNPPMLDFDAPRRPSCRQPGGRPGCVQGCMPPPTLPASCLWPCPRGGFAPSGDIAMASGRPPPPLWQRPRCLIPVRYRHGLREAAPSPPSCPAAIHAAAEAEMADPTGRRHPIPAPSPSHPPPAAATRRQEVAGKAPSAGAACRDHAAE